ncbi:hypothetical protein STPYR_12615 [uncultured Stenotrophomonas sp.]|uniref:Uncharacterized protein n=1 Tax=uncultured Stenotrophomonas sp. TaxID=165438 RepID=A0A1Y5Q5U5_9GAMM|nr:hypothetical protein STPYR_12615 [uncultured Stenotrophomonas sp.]
MPRSGIGLNELLGIGCVAYDN